MGTPATPPDSGWWDTLRIYVFGGGFAATLGSAGALFRWLLDRHDRGERARAKRIEVEADAEAAERARQESVNASQVSRLTAEIVRKDEERKSIEADRDDGWRGLNRAISGWERAVHDAETNETILLGRIELAGLPIPKLRKLIRAPDAETLAGRTASPKAPST